ncbi:MAG: ABC transporter permease [Ruminococcus sp.]|nr:ABC transporter permease [Ruminococcus sp.]
MKLNKRYARSIRSNLSFYVSASVLTMVGLLLFYLFYIAGTGIGKYGDEFFSRNHREDASFTTMQEISDEEIRELEKKYDVQLEKERYVNTEEKNGDHVRVFRANKEIDLYELIEGAVPHADDEAVISAGYAENNDISIGDKVTIGGKNYKVTGWFLRPDYLYMLENITDDYKNVTTFFLAALTDNAFDDAFEQSSFSYKVIYNNADKEKDFRLAVNDDYYTLSYLSADENKRISFVHEQADMFILGAWVMLVMLPFITVALISIIIGRKIRSEQKIIGTLSAQGYKRSTLMLHYSLLAVIPGLVGGVLMAAAAELLSDWFGGLGLADYEPMQPEFKLPILIALAGIVVPTLIYFIAAMLKVKKLLKHDTVELLSGSVGTQSKTHRMLRDTKMKVRRKFAIRSVLGSPGRSFVVFLGVFLGAMIVAFSYIFIDSVKAVGSQAMNEFGTFEYEYIFNTIQDDEPENADAVMVVAYENSDGKRFSLMGVDKDCERWNLTDSGTNSRADIEDGWYMSSLCAKIFGIEAGDEFTFRSIATLEEYTVTIKGIIKNGYQNYIVSTRNNASEITGLDTSLYNCILTDDSRSFDGGIVQEIITSNTFNNQMENMLDEMSGMVYALIIIGAIICIAALYVSINMLVSENAVNISMLKVLGYDRKKIDKMVLNGNHLLLIPGLILGMLTGYGAMAWYCDAFVETEGLMIPVAYSVPHIILTICIVTLCYFVSLLLVRRKVDKVDMIESLKDNRD